MPDTKIHYTVLTLFTDMIRTNMGTSIMGRALENGIIGLNVIDIRDHSCNRHRRVDDYPYGGGAGMVMEAGPVYAACEQARGLYPDKKTKLIFMTPAGRTFNQQIARELSEYEHLIFLCGHYEGIDERVLETEADDHISVGDYVLTGGELPALVVMDAVSRLIPGVLSNEESAGDESFENGLLEYPQYTRPEIFMDKPVPEVLLSGHHENIALWRLAQSLIRTRAHRNDLMERYTIDRSTYKKLNKLMKSDLLNEREKEALNEILLILRKNAQ